MNIYKAFATQTGRVIKFLTIARQYEVSTRLQVPRLKHAPLSLAKSLEDYLNDPDFEINRRQFLAQQEARRTGKKPSTNAVSSTSTQKKTTSASPDQGPAVPAKPSASVGRGPAPDLIDFFASIESNQESMFGNPAPTQTTQPGEYQPGMQLPPMMTGQGQVYTQLGMPGQVFPHDPMIAHVQNQSMGQQDPLLAAQFLPMNTGVYGDQPMQQPQQMFGPNPGQTLTQGGMANLQPQSTGMMQSQQLQQQTTNPFRQSMMPTGGQQSTDPSSRQSTNPFAKSPMTSMPGLPEGSMAAFAPQTISPSFVAQPHLQFPQPPGISPPAMQYPTQQQQPQQQQPQQQYAPALQSMPTGTNPFARSQMGAGPSQPMISPPVSGGLVPQPTGSTNPFRQSMLPSNQATMGGMQTEQMSTIPVFPRPGQIAPQQQQQY